MILRIEISGAELDEIQESVDTINAELAADGKPTINIEQYAANILIGWSNARFRQEYIHEAQNQDIATLRTKLGKVKDLRKARK